MVLPFGHLQPRLAGVVDEEAVGQDLPRLVHDDLQAPRRWRRRAGQGEMVAEFSWLNCSMAAGHLGVHRHHRRQRHHLAGGGADEEIAQPFGVVAVFLAGTCMMTS
jgi:hypothetical protein